MKMVKQRRPGKSLSLKEAMEQATDLCQRRKDECGSPGLVVAVSVDGQLVWTQGLGYADVENRLPCKPESVMRIASISKSITMAAVAKAMENGDLDLDKPVQAYVPQFPEKTVNGEKVTVTTRQLVSHLSGVRHYSKDYFKTKDAAKDNASSATTTAPAVPAAEKKNPSKTLAVTGEFLLEEYYIKDKLDSTESALALFKDDPLVHKPDSKFLYTTHGWTLIAAVLEGATKRKFPDLIRLLISDLGLDSTYLDENEPLIYNRSRFYVRNKNHHLENAPYVDCAYKYAGGGMLSTVTDLVHFGNAMLYSYQYREAHGSQTAQKQDSKTAPPKDINTTPQPRNAVTPTSGMHQPSSDLGSAHHSCNLPGYLKPATMQQIWQPVEKTQHSKDNLYAMGWEVMPEKRKFGFGRSQPFYVYHTGAAIGASSVLLILPTSNSGEVGKGDDSVVTPLKGVTVAIITNLIKVSLTKTALNVAKVFDQVSLD
ncbi:hypothetical protein V1264_005430 [Littorina saxatilis]|uniref:Beta-lactamase-related domain-containing protein n=2 Tax=Littorina saxatilis TaxID=31220 RepID=A0AAN9AYZ4_9CAEN